MTDKEAMKLALEALEQTLQTLDDENAKPGGAIADTIWHSEHETLFDYLGSEITALKEALAQPEQEPVAWGVFEGNLHDMFFSQSEAQEMADLKGSHAEVRPLYTTPPQRTWVGLTLTQVKLLGEGVQEEAVKSGHSRDWVFYTHINEALKEKNCG
jgi:hypothetical protein